VSKPSSPAKSTDRYLTLTVPPKNSKPSSALYATSQWSTTVPEPTPPKVMPLISLIAPTTAPPCHTRTYCMEPDESVGLVPPYVCTVTPSIVVVVALFVGALPSRIRPPHLPRVSSTVSALVSVDTDDDDDSVGLKAVKVIGAVAEPSASREPPFSMIRAGAPPPSAATGEA
jgi:hypothetical protein